MNRMRLAPLVWLLAALACTSVGCEKPSSPAVSSPAVSSPAVSSDTVWDAYYIHGEKVGHLEMTTRTLQEKTGQVVEIDSHNILEFRRFGDTSLIDIQMTTLETTNDEVLRITLATKMGTEEVKIEGEPHGDELKLTIESAGQTAGSRLPWQSDIRGFQGVERSLLRHPMKPGETRRLSLVAPVINQVAIFDAELVAHERDSTKLLDGSQDLLRIDYTMTPRGAKSGGIQTVLWTDEQGQILKTLVAGLQLEGYRTTRERALEKAKSTSFDLGFGTLVKVNLPLPPVTETGRVRYRVILDGGDPTKLFPETEYQHVVSTGPNTAEITVSAPGYKNRATDPETVTAASPSTADDLASNDFLQSDNETIVAMARKARRDAEDPRVIARHLESYVHDTVANKNFTHGFATALEVARSREGDCTEHAVLLAALARACQIPSRVVYGLVYVSKEQAFGFHMWTEVFDGQHWLPLDATLGAGGIGASHIELGESDLKDAAAGTTLGISVVNVIGRLKIEVLAVE